MPQATREAGYPAAPNAGSLTIGALPAVPPLPGSLPATLLCNRVYAVAIHIPMLAFRTQARLSRDSGVSHSAVSRMVRGKARPSLAVALKVTQALSHRLGRPLDLFEVFSLDGTYPTPSVCRLVGCPSCLPPEAYDAEENLRPEYQDVLAGEWTLDAVAGKEER